MYLSSFSKIYDRQCSHISNNAKINLEIIFALYEKIFLTGICRQSYAMIQIFELMYH